MKLEELMAAEIEALQDDSGLAQGGGAQPSRASASPPRGPEFRKDEIAVRWDYRAQRLEARNQRAMKR